MLAQTNSATGFAWLLVLAVMAFFAAVWVGVEIRVLPLRVETTKLRLRLWRTKLVYQVALGRLAQELGVSRAEARALSARGFTPSLERAFWTNALEMVAARARGAEDREQIEKIKAKIAELPPETVVAQDPSIEA